MNHVDDGTIVEIRDGSLVETDVQLHVEGCPMCRDAVASATHRAAAVSRALASLDGPVDVQRAKAKVRKRLDDGRAGERSRQARAWPLGRVAAVLLLSAGAVWALPGSPLRDALRGTGRSETDLAPPPAMPVQETLPVGIEFPVSNGQIRVSLDEVVADSELEVLWVAGTHARITAAPGSRYSVAAGHAQATVVGGPVRVELPRGATLISLEANGRMLLQRSSDGLSLPGRVLEQDADRILFSIQGR